MFVLGHIKCICGEFYCTPLFKTNLQLKHIEFLLILMVTMLCWMQHAETDFDATKIMILNLSIKNVLAQRKNYDFAARFPFQKQESNHRPILLFFHFCKIRGHTCFHTQLKQNYEPDSPEILTVAIYENLLHNSIFLLR